MTNSEKNSEAPRHRGTVINAFRETAGISLHQMRTFIALRDTEGWLTCREVARIANVAERTANLHCNYFDKAGIVDKITISPGYRYRFREDAEAINPGLMAHIHAALQAVGTGA